MSDTGARQSWAQGPRFTLLVSWLPALCLSGCERPPHSEPAVRPGIEVLAADSVHLLTGLRVGLITNHTGVDRRGTPSARTLLEAGVRLEALFAPEHGLSGRIAGGTPVEDARDPETGLPVYSMYGGLSRSDSLVTAGLDALVFDIQDIGARYYTYVSTMLAAMRTAAAAGALFVVADRPDPIGGVLVQGNVLDPAFASLVGSHPVAMRHGMTPGELARMFNRELELGVRLHVVPASGWKRAMWADETGLPWVRTSPNMPDLESAIHYPGTCLFEGTNLSVGRGTDRPFQQVGAPWLDAEQVARRVAAHDLPGVRVEAVSFTPSAPDDAKYDGIPVEGVRLTLTDRQAYDPTRTAVLLLIEIRRSAGANWEWRGAAFDRLAGTDRLRVAIDEGSSPQALFREWKKELASFRDRRSEFLLYP